MISQTCEASTGNCTAIACDPTVSDYAANLCAATKTACVVTDSNVPAVGTCQICDGTTTTCGTGYTCNPGVGTDPMTCVADTCVITADCLGWETCNNVKQCVPAACETDGVCAATGICDVSGGNPGVCVACVANNPTAIQTCPSTSYCKVGTFGVCTTDCADDAGCLAYQNCVSGQCVGDTCTQDSGCGNAATGSTTFAKCVNGSGSTMVCEPCVSGSTGTNICTAGMFCSTVAAPVGTYTAGTCYNTECNATNTDCTDLTK
jgi:hypothetical protein